MPLGAKRLTHDHCPGSQGTSWPATLRRFRMWLVMTRGSMSVRIEQTMFQYQAITCESFAKPFMVNVRVLSCRVPTFCSMKWIEVSHCQQLSRLFLFMTFTFGAWDLRMSSPLPTLSLLGRWNCPWLTCLAPNKTIPVVFLVSGLARTERSSTATTTAGCDWSRPFPKKTVGNFGHIRIALIDAYIRYHLDSFGKQKAVKTMSITTHYELYHPIMSSIPLISGHVTHVGVSWKCRTPSYRPKWWKFFNGETNREKGYPQFRKHHINPSSTIINHHRPSSTIRILSITNPLLTILHWYPWIIVDHYYITVIPVVVLICDILFSLLPWYDNHDFFTQFADQVFRGQQARTSGRCFA